jgi:CheY-like chemotaxis protein
VTALSTAAVNGSVLIVDDHPSFREAARLALETDGFIVVGAVADGESAVIETLRRQPDIVLLDVGLPGMTGFEAASRLRDADSSVAILLASSRERSDFGPLIVDCGANGFVQKEQLSGETIRTEIAASRLTCLPEHPDVRDIRSGPSKRAARSRWRIQSETQHGATHLTRSCRLTRCCLGDRTLKRAPRLTRIVRTKTPLSFVSRTRPTGFHLFLRSTSSRYRFRPGRPSRI